MNDKRLTELQEKYKDRNLLEELAWGIYANHSGYTSKQNGEFLNWLCLMAYKALKEKPQGCYKKQNAKHCNTCLHYQQLTKIQELGYCETKNYHVSANSDKCINYKEKQ